MSHLRINPTPVAQEHVYHSRTFSLGPKDTGYVPNCNCCNILLSFESSVRRMEDEGENADQEEGMRTQKVAGSVVDERIGLIIGGKRKSA